MPYLRYSEGISFVRYSGKPLTEFSLLGRAYTGSRAWLMTEWFEEYLSVDASPAVLVMGPPLDYFLGKTREAGVVAGL